MKKSFIIPLKVPCKNCLLLPRCKHKNYGKLIRECATINALVYDFNKNWKGHQMMTIGHRRDGTDKILQNLYNVLKPSTWHLMFSIERQRYLVEHHNLGRTGL